MSATTILDNLTARGVRVWAEADRLKLDAPRGVLTDQDRAQLAEHKPELLATLTATQTCEKCGATIQAESGDRWRHTWCPNNCRWTWAATDGGTLADSGAPGHGEARRRVAELIALNQCPDGCGKLTLQDREREVWFCPTCRVAIVAGVIQ